MLLWSAINGVVLPLTMALLASAPPFLVFRNRLAKATSGALALGAILFMWLATGFKPAYTSSGDLQWYSNAALSGYALLYSLMPLFVLPLMPLVFVIAAASSVIRSFRFRRWLAMTLVLGSVPLAGYAFVRYALSSPYELACGGSYSQFTCSAFIPSRIISAAATLGFILLAEAGMWLSPPRGELSGPTGLTLPNSLTD